MHSPRILIVEDDRIIAKAIEMSLSIFGYHVVASVATGEEAVRVCRESRPDLVIMDIILEGDMDGLQAAERIRPDLDIPVIYVTAHSDLHSLERLTATQPYGYLTKPISQLELKATIETALYKHSMEKALRESEEKYRLIFSNKHDDVDKRTRHALETIVGQIGSAIARIRAEQKLSESRERLELAVKGAGLGFWDWDFATGRAVRNARAIEIYGVEPDEMEPTFEMWADSVHPEDRSRVLETFRQHLDGVTPTYEAEYRLVSRTGRATWVQALGTVSERDAQGTALRVTGVLLDISDRKRAQDELQEERQKLDIVTRSLGVAMCVISRDFRTLWANRLMKNVLGDDLEGGICYERHRKRTEICPNCGVREIFETGVDGVVREQNGEDLDGRKVCSQIMASALRDCDGSIKAALVVAVPFKDRPAGED